MLKKKITEKIKKNLLLYKIAQTVRYPFLTPMQKALIKFRNEDGEERRHQYDICESDIIFDGGGYKGEWAEAFLGKNCKIYIFEPLSYFCDIMNEKFKGYGRVKVCNFGLDCKNHTSEISLEEDASSQYHPGNKSEKAEFIDILEFLNKEHIEKVKLLKLNIEGGEYDILEYLLETGEITRFENIQVQFHNLPEIKGKERMKKIWKGLEKTHVLEWAYRPFIHESWRLYDSI